MSTPVGSTVAMSRRCGQLTLFDCVAAGGSESTAKRQKIDTADAAGNAESNSSRATDKPLDPPSGFCTMCRSIHEFVPQHLWNPSYATVSISIVHNARETIGNEAKETAS